jgi:hypothetical protein
MKRPTPWVWVAVLLLAYQTATADVIATVVDAAGDPNSIALYGAGSFDVSIQVSTDTSLSALQLKLEETTSPGSDYFALNSVSFDASKWDIPVNPDDPDYRFDPSPQALNVSNGYTSELIADVAGDVDNGTGTGIFQFATLNITYSGPAEAGDYYLNLTEILYGDMNRDEYAGSAGTAYHVQVVPEPGTAVLGLIGFSIVAWARRDGSRQRRR